MNAQLRLRKFQTRAGQPNWDHEHCDFCWPKIVEEKGKKDGDDLLVEAYVTIDGSHWVCPKCFADFRTPFQWTSVE